MCSLCLLCFSGSALVSSLTISKAVSRSHKTSLPLIHCSQPRQPFSFVAEILLQVFAYNRSNKRGRALGWRALELHSGDW